MITATTQIITKQNKKKWWTKKTHNHKQITKQTNKNKIIKQNRY